MRHDQVRDEPASDVTVFELKLSLDTDHGTAHLFGQLDLATADGLQTVLDQLRYDGYRHVVLDLSELEFLSATGLSVFARAAADYADSGGSLSLTHPTRMARRVLALARLEHLTSPTPVTSRRNGAPCLERARGLGSRTLRDVVAE